MNRRRFFASSLPSLLGGTALLGGATLTAMADNVMTDKPTPKPSPRRIRFMVSLLLNPNLNLGSTNAHIITVVTEEDVATYASFLQMYTFEENGNTSKSQAFGPHLRVTPHIEADGRITVNGEVQFEEATSNVALANQRLPIDSKSLSVMRTVESGHSVILGSVGTGDAQKQIQLTATILKPGETI